MKVLAPVNASLGRSESFILRLPTTSRKDLYKYIRFKVVKQINQIGAMKTFSNPHCKIFMEDLLIILKELHENVSQF